MVHSNYSINQEYANLVTPLSAEEYESLKESMKRNGQLISIIRNSQGVILDGHHRYKICKELGIEPKLETKDFPDKLHAQMFVIESNLRRRHLNDFQRIKLALKSKLILQEIAQQNQKAGRKIDTSVKHLTQVGRVNEQIAKLAGVSHETVRKVHEIERDQQLELGQRLLTPALIGALESGDITINSAYETLKESKQERDGLTRRIKKDKEKHNRILGGEKPSHKQLSKENDKLLMTINAASQKIDRDTNIIESQSKELEQARQEQKISAQVTTGTKEAPTETEVQVGVISCKNRIDKLEDYDPTKRESYDRQTLYRVIDWLFEELRKLRANSGKK
jgi:ParB-like chromosome segregation protein Spo0J